MQYPAIDRESLDQLFNQGAASTLIGALPPEAKIALQMLIAEIRDQANEIAEERWQQRRALQYIFWKGTAIYAALAVKRVFS